MAFFTSAEPATSAWVVIAPIVTLPPATRMAESPRPARSTSIEGLASRCFSTGMKVMPPASALASGSEERSFSASGRLSGF